MYTLIRSLLFLMDAETAHEIVTRFARLCTSPFAQRLLRAQYGGGENATLERRVAGLRFPNPIGLAAGFDKNGYLVDVLPALGFGFLEIGTVTPRPQRGNPKPRLFRLPKDKAFINRFGFNNEGVEAVAARLARRKSSIILGANIGKNKDTPNEKAADDYAECFHQLHRYVDYITVNVSSPNTPNLRELQSRNALVAILSRLQQINADKKPIFLKIAPDLNFAQLDDIIAVVNETGISGVIATNTTISRDGLQTSKNQIAKIGEGGISGKPVAEKTNQIIRYLYEGSHGEIPIIGAGGIFSAEDAAEKIRAGASLLQVYTGLIYEGPGLIKRIKEGRVKLA